MFGRYPNIIGNISRIYRVFAQASAISGCLVVPTTSGDWAALSNSGEAGGANSLGIDAAQSSAVYGNAAVVQTPAIQTLIIIKI